MKGSMLGAVALTGHVVAALAYALMALWVLGRADGDWRQRALGAAFATTGLWAGVIAMLGPLAEGANLAESLRNFAWLTFLLMLFQAGSGGIGWRTVRRIYIALAAAAAVRVTLALAGPLGVAPESELAHTLVFVGLGLRILVLAGGLLLLHNLYTAAARGERWRLRAPLFAIGIMWGWDLNLSTITYLYGRWPATLLAGRGPLMVALLVPFAISVGRKGPWRLSLSRAAAFQSVSLMAIGSYLIFMVLATQAMAVVGGPNIRAAQIALVLIMSAAAAILLPSTSVRAWVRVKIAKHFFSHRYDYREEWLRFTGTLGRPGDGTAPLNQRVIKAVADIVEAPGGVLLVDDHAGGLVCAARWRWPTMDPPSPAAGPAFVGHVERTGRILEFDALRGNDPEDDAERALTPDWLLAAPSAWIAVPLLHMDRLIGVVVVERPKADRALDWEDFDLLKVAGRQVATYLAEAQTQEALSEAERFDEFNRRFAFILHDIKNIVSQLSLVARNAERHAEKPEFRRDMVATLQSSVGKMNALLALLSTQNRAEPARPRPLSLMPFVREVVGVRRDRNPIQLAGADGVVALADPARLEQALVHIIQNAVDASPPDEPVRLTVHGAPGRALIQVEDSGRGMSADFIRSDLFKPFVSTKANGFGVGAFEARSLLAAMGGSLEVESRLGEGSRFTLVLPTADAAAMDGAPTPAAA